MYALILDVARADERIRAAILNGSRANPHAARDIFQDYDIVYVVTELETFKQNPNWIDCFGERMILQLPDDMLDPPPGDEDGYVYLMQFADGNRIDLGLVPLARLDRLEQDSLSVLLLDKDGLIPPFPPACEDGYLPIPPSAKAYADCCNEFWWVCPYVAKGLWRGEILYAKYMLDQVVRAELLKMLVWRIGDRTQFEKNPGKHGKYFEQYLDPEEWDLLLKTYSDADYDHTWEALIAACRLFREGARFVGSHFGFEYPQGEDERVSAHLEHVRTLPKDSSEIY